MPKRRKPGQDHRRSYLDILKSAARSVQKEIDENLEEAKRFARQVETEAKRRILLTIVQDNGNLQAKALRFAADKAPIQTFDVITTMALRNPEGVAWFLFGPEAAQKVTKGLKFADDLKRSIRAQFPGSKRTEESIRRQKELQQRMRERARARAEQEALAIKPKPGELAGERLERLLRESDERRERALRERGELPRRTSDSLTTSRDASVAFVQDAVAVQAAKNRQRRALEQKNALRVSGADPEKIRAANQAFRDAIAAVRRQREDEREETNSRGDIKVRSYVRSDGTRVRAFRRSR